MDKSITTMYSDSLVLNCQDCDFYNPDGQGGCKSPYVLGGYACVDGYRTSVHNIKVNDEGIIEGVIA